jgi:hypothetical protein
MRRIRRGAWIQHGNRSRHSGLLLASSAWEVFRALLGEMAGQDARGLADFDQVAVRVSQVAADLVFADGSRHPMAANQGTVAACVASVIRDG